MHSRRPCACCLVTKRSEEHTSELQSQSNLVCRLLLEKKKTSHVQSPPSYHYLAARHVDTDDRLHAVCDRDFSYHHVPRLVNLPLLLQSVTLSLSRSIH